MAIENLFRGGRGAHLRGRSKWAGRPEEDRMKLQHFSMLVGLALAACSGQEREGTGQGIQAVMRIPCSATADCGARGGACTAGQCTADNECASDADCAGGAVCSADPNFG